MAFLLTVLAHSHGDGSRLALGEREWAVETVEGTSDEDFKLWTESSGAKLVRKVLSLAFCLLNVEYSPRKR